MCGNVRYTVSGEPVAKVLPTLGKYRFDVNHTSRPSAIDLTVGNSLEAPTAPMPSFQGADSS